MKLYCSKRSCLLTRIFLAVLSGLAVGMAHYRGVFPYRDVRATNCEASSALHDSRITSQTDATFDPLKYLPAGAKIGNRDKDVVFADLDGDGQQEVVIFYALGSSPNDTKANILVLKPHGTDYAQLWENVYDGSWGFAEPSGVYDLNRSGRPQIVAYRTIGASCPGVLDIYEYRNGSIKRITGDWADNGQCQGAEIKDLNAIYTPEAVPTSARIVWGKQAVEIYILQRRYPEAIRLCEEMLRMIDDPRLSVPNAVIKGDETPEQLNRIMEWFEVQKIEGKATVYGLLGDSYKAAGKLQEARQWHDKAEEFRSEAKERRSRLPH